MEDGGHMAVAFQPSFGASSTAITAWGPRGLRYGVKLGSSARAEFT